ncbi:MAG: hypothetical protein JSW62_01760 [Thermoplasmatales archaeon]|nr:MAG: hypothetical protein JSW62_01760 [Thermoplasmatales archaeon]
MEKSTKAQITVGLLACFAIGVGLFQDALAAQDQIFAFGLVIVYLIAVLVISIVLMNLLKWVDIFDLKTNAVLTLIVLITIRLGLEITISGIC